MNKETIIGGVSPLKKVVKAKRGGKHTASAKRKSGGYGKSSAYNVRTRFQFTKPDRAAAGGSTTQPDGGGGGAVPSPTKPYTITPDGEVKINFDPTININNNPNISNIVNTAGGTGKDDGGKGTRTKTETETTGHWEKYTIPGTPAEQLPKYSEAWKSNKDNIQTMYKDFDAYVADIEGQKDMVKNKDWEGLAKLKNMSVEEVKKEWAGRTKPGTPDQEGYRWVEGPDKTKTITETYEYGGSPATKKEGKYNYGGYRFAAGNGVKKKN